MDYVRKAQLMQYEANRAQFEAFSAARGEATGVVYWQATGAWPTLHWSLWGDDLATGGGFYGARKANAPLHALLEPATRTVVLANDTARARTLAVEVRVAALDGRVVWRRAASARVGRGQVARLLGVPRPALRAPYLVALVLREDGAVVDRNVYWLPAVDEALDWDATTWWVTPTARHADLRALSATRATVTARACLAGPRAVRLELEAGARPALLVRPRLTAGAGGPDALPAVWSDSYVSLLPGEREVLTVEVRPSALRGRRPALELVGFNVARRRLPRSRPADDAVAGGRGGARPARPPAARPTCSRDRAPRSCRSARSGSPPRSRRPRRSTRPRRGSSRSGARRPSRTRRPRRCAPRRARARAAPRASGAPPRIAPRATSPSVNVLYSPMSAPAAASSRVAQASGRSWIRSRYWDMSPSSGGRFGGETSAGLRNRQLLGYARPRSHRRGRWTV